jgi:hypothetical protein
MFSFWGKKDSSKKDKKKKDKNKKQKDVEAEFRMINEMMKG